LGDLNPFVAAAQKAMAGAMRTAGREIGYLGRDEVNAEAARLFGPDRRFSGAKGSKTAGRQATANFKMKPPDAVTINPSGDPWYITLFGRGRSNIAPKHRARGRARSAIRTPFGAFRRVHGGAMHPKPVSVLDPAVKRIAEGAADILANAIIEGMH